MIGKINTDKNQVLVPEHLKNYEKKALELGASRAAVILAENIPIDERVTLKCQIPRCFGYGASAHCPPNTIKPAELRERLKQYKWAVFFSLEVPPEVIVRNKETITERIAAYLKVFKIVSELEAAAFYDGHYMAFGLAAGSCRSSFCAKEDTCVALEGKKCRFSLRARPSMEATGIDVFNLMALLDWNIYPIGSGAKQGEVAAGNLTGIVVVQ